MVKLVMVNFFNYLIELSLRLNQWDYYSPCGSTPIFIILKKIACCLRCFRIRFSFFKFKYFKNPTEIEQSGTDPNPIFENVKMSLKNSKLCPV